MQPIRTFNVSPSLPASLEPLRQLAYNLYWDWNTEIKELFRRLDRDLWEATRHNPVALLARVSQSRLQEVAADDGFLAHMERAVGELNTYLHDRSWYKHKRANNVGKECFAYFCAEFGLVDCLPIYSGGLGVLAGDHLKSASDLGLPLVAVGLLYQKGYFAQYLNAEGWQQERYPVNDFHNIPVQLERKPDGSELRIAVEYPGRMVYARVWRVQVGVVPLYLLDTNIEPNSAYDQDITDALYGGDLDTRIHQEIMLGIGGFRALEALGHKPSVYHMNEGHSGFLILEHIRVLMQRDGLSFVEARQVAQSTQIFTTHTPVSAGFDLFPPDKTIYYVGHYAGIYGLSKDDFMGLGRENAADLNSPFSMAALAMKTSSFVNGVAKLHGVVSREMFQNMWKDVPIDEVPITSVTNGVHARSCVAKSVQELYDRYLGPEWSEKSIEDPIWHKMDAIPDEELWRNHEHSRSEMVVYVRDRIVSHLKERGATLAEINHAQEALDPGVLTIGFARRFATYKRATLFLRNLERIKKILVGNKERKVQFVIAGKAHPKDIPGKALIRDIVHFTRSEGMNSVVFVPDYDIYVSRVMVAGCDIWLNTPRRPHEASGTSGMKAAMNGLPNLSILDGWWDEADYVRTGWPIGHGELYSDEDYQDSVEANAFYDLLEQEIVPLFYDRDKEGLPRKWIAKMKDAIRLNCPTFNTARMLRDYATVGYFPASDRNHVVTDNHYQAGKDLAHWKQKMLKHWGDLKVHTVDVSAPEDINVNQSISVKSLIQLGSLEPHDVQVELYKGAVDTNGKIVNADTTVMTYQGRDGNGNSLYTSEIAYAASGLQGLSLRVLPHHPHLSNPYELGSILWA
ncbi:alpha-glucan family phosphorylase [Chamaesiphon minutus]|uniref:glycogen phosphorylase n=1 Tax=Chamaesiphon minutus (strain ATCC 27169 / PCC 6605) TaxID=1173020 RepID=K9UJJ5_CHAP6|nr:alpha-glucan family phosphorylase [Chamaesiphon minutus]AFY94364.1 alpha-glucan phosphorylase [Chamaesiphon minutus PCC 6605]